MFLVIANKNLFLFSKCRASVLFCTPVSPACRHQVEAEDLGKVGASSWAGTRAAGEAKREVFPPKGSRRAVNQEEPTPGQRSHKMVKPSVQPPLPASVGGPQRHLQTALAPCLTPSVIFPGQ